MGLVQKKGRITCQICRGIGVVIPAAKMMIAFKLRVTGFFDTDIKYLVDGAFFEIALAT